MKILGRTTGRRFGSPETPPRYDATGRKIDPDRDAIYIQNAVDEVLPKLDSIPPGYHLLIRSTAGLFSIARSADGRLSVMGGGEGPVFATIAQQLAGKLGISADQT